MPGVGFVDVDLAGGHTAVKKALHIPLHQQIEHIFRDIAQVINAVAVALELLHQFLHPAAGAEDMHPIVQHALHLKGTALGTGVLQHSLVAVIAGKFACVQQLPLLAAKGQVVNFLFHFGVAQPVYKVCLGVKIHQYTADIKKVMLLYINTASLVLDVFQIFSIVYHNRAGAFHPLA